MLATFSAGSAGSAGNDAFALDAQLAAAMRVLRSAEPRIGRRLRTIVDQRLYRAPHVTSVDRCVRDRLGISVRNAWALLKIEKSARRAAAFAEAYDVGALSWVRALTLLPVVDRQTAQNWVARAQVVTVRRLTDEVNWVLEAREVIGDEVSLAPPPLDSVLLSPLQSSAESDSGAPRPGLRPRRLALRGPGMQLAAQPA